MSLGFNDSSTALLSVSSASHSNPSSACRLVSTTKNLSTLTLALLFRTRTFPTRRACCWWRGWSQTTSTSFTGKPVTTDWWTTRTSSSCCRSWRGCWSSTRSSRARLRNLRPAKPSCNPKTKKNLWSILACHVWFWRRRLLLGRH